MKQYYNIHTIYLLMMVLTVLTYALGETGYSGVVAMSFLLIAAMLKCSFIISDFMGLRGVSLLWRAIMYGWLWLVCLSIAITYVFSI